MSFKLGELVTDQYGVVGTIIQQMEVKLIDYKRGLVAMDKHFKTYGAIDDGPGKVFCSKLKMYPEALRWRLISFSGPIKMSASTTSVWLVRYSNGDTWWEGAETLANFSNN